MFAPFQSYTIEFLDPVSINSEGAEDPLGFARRTAQIIADSLQVPSTPFLYSDKRKWLKLRSKLVDEGYEFDIIFDEKNNTIDVINRLKVSITSNKHVVPVDKSSDSICSTSSSSINKQLLLKHIYETWGLHQADSNHLAFKKGNFNI